MQSETMDTVIQALNKAEVMSEDEVKGIIKNALDSVVARGKNFSYYGYFVYNSIHPKKWLEFDVHLKLHPDIWKRTSAISNNKDPDVKLAREITDDILEEINEYYTNREQTRIIIDFNSDLETGKLNISISE